MQINSLMNLPAAYLQSAFQNVISNNSSTSNTSALSSLSTQDTNRLSPFAQMMSTLQNLQQTDPAKYQQVTDQISKNLQTAATQAQSNGDTALATRLNQLSTDFKSASAGGQLPNIQDLAQAIGKGGGHHHGHHHATSQTDDATTSDATTSQKLSSLFSTMLSSTQQTNAATDPFSVIMQSLNQAGLSTQQS